MTYIADLSDMTLPGGDSRADFSVGWLGSEVEDPGITGSMTLDALHQAKGRNQMRDDSLDSHTCEMCGQAHGHGQFFIEDTNCRYILPNLVIHYITAHSYRLPAEVEQAVLDNRRQVRPW